MLLQTGRAKVVDLREHIAILNCCSCHLFDLLVLVINPLCDGQNLYKFNGLPLFRAIFH